VSGVFRCASTGVNASGTMLPSLESRLLGEAGAPVRFEIRAMQESGSRRCRKRFAVQAYWGRPTRRSRSAKRGSPRSGSSRGSTPTRYIQSERARYAFSSQEKARSLSPNAAYTQATL
jgi:hypothetical protein